MTDWGTFFDAQHERLLGFGFGDAAGAIERRLDDENTTELKRFVRGLRRRAPDRVDGWRVVVALRKADLRGAVRVRGSILNRSPIPARGVDEPDPQLRCWALCNALLQAFEHSHPPSGWKDVPAVADIPGAREVWWWLTGEHPMERLKAHERQNALLFARAAMRSLAPFSLLSKEAASHRMTVLEEWAGLADQALDEELVSDPLRRDFVHELRRTESTVDEACLVCRQVVLGEGSAAIQTARQVLGTMFGEIGAAHDPRGFATWCGQAHAIGVLYAAELVDDGVEGYLRRVSERLVEALPAILGAQPLSLLRTPVDVAFWRSVGVLARALADADRLDLLEQLLAAVANSGSLTGSCARPVARMTGLVIDSPSIDIDRAEHTVARFMFRLAYVSARRRRHGPRGIWKRTLSRYCRVAGEQQVVRELERWWRPGGEGSVDAEDANLVTDRLGWTELPDPATAPARLAFWSATDQRTFLDACEDSDRLGRIPAQLERPAPRAAVANTGASLSLHVDYLDGRHGERYVIVKLFGVRGGEVAVVAEDDRYPSPFDQRSRLNEVGEALVRLRERAELGRLTRSDIARVQKALRGVASEEFWAQLGEQESQALELSVGDPSIPWESIQVVGNDRNRPLGLTAPTFRRRGGKVVASEGDPKRLLLLYDPSFEGAEDEVEEIEEAFASGEREVVVVDSALAFAELDKSGIDIVHYAGHQGPGDDATPSLALGDGRLTIVDLVDAFYQRP
ncbi:MAG: hypothetical protein AAGF12_34135, partial [Myxococcota bacterium]